MTESDTHSSTLSTETAATILADLRKMSEARFYSDEGILTLVHGVSDGANGLFVSLQDAMGQLDGGVASLFMSGDEELELVRCVAGAVMGSNWNGDSLPEPWDGKAVVAVHPFHPRDTDTAHVRDQVERAVLWFLNEFAASADVDEDRVERIAKDDLLSAMLRYVSLEAVHSGAMPPVAGMVEDQDADEGDRLTVFRNATTGLALRVDGRGRTDEYVLTATSEDGAEGLILRTSDLDAVRSAYADRWISAVAVSIGLGFHPDTPAGDYEPPLDRGLAFEYGPMIDMAHAYGNDPYRVGMEAWEAAGVMERDAPTP